MDLHGMQADLDGMWEEPRRKREERAAAQASADAAEGPRPKGPEGSRRPYAMPSAARTSSWSSK